MIFFSFQNKRKFQLFAPVFFISYAKDVVDIGYWRLFLTPIVFTYSISMAIFCQYMVSVCVCVTLLFLFKLMRILYFSTLFQLNYVTGYGMALVSYMQLSFMCIAGESFKVLLCLLDTV